MVLSWHVKKNDYFCVPFLETLADNLNFTENIRDLVRLEI